MNIEFLEEAGAGDQSQATLNLLDLTLGDLRQLRSEKREVTPPKPVPVQELNALLPGHQIDAVMKNLVDTVFKRQVNEQLDDSMRTLWTARRANDVHNLPAVRPDEYLDAYRPPHIWSENHGARTPRDPRLSNPIDQRLQVGTRGYRDAMEREYGLSIIVCGDEMVIQDHGYPYRNNITVHPDGSIEAFQTKGSNVYDIRNKIPVDEALKKFQIGRPGRGS